MARIPMGNFGQGGGTAPLVRTRVAGGDDPVAQALQGLAQTGMQLAGNEIEERRQAADMLARTRAQNALLDDEIEQRGIVSEIEGQVADGTLPFDQAEAELGNRLDKRQTEEIPGLDEVGTLNYQRGLQRNRFGSTQTVKGVAEKAFRAESKAQIVGVRDRLGKLASDPNADLDALVAAGSELAPVAAKAGMTTFGKDHQDFSDRAYKDNASARLVAARDSIELLNALEADLTQEGGRYFNKLDASATNTLLASVQSRKAQLEAKADTESRRGEAAADRVLGQFERQIATTVQAPIETMQEWADTVSQLGTPEQKEQFQGLLASEIEVRRVLGMLPAEQTAALEEMRAKQRTGGATVQDQANLKRLESAVTAHLEDLRNQPLVAFQRMTGDTLPMLDLAALAGGDTAAMQGQIAARQDTLRAMREQYGQEVGSALLLPQEAAQLSAALAKAPPVQAAQLFGTLSKVFPDGGTYRAVVQQVAPDSPVRAYAGLIFAEQRETSVGGTGALWWKKPVSAHAGDVAQTLLEGEAILNKSAGDRAADGKGGAFPVATPAAFADAIAGLSFEGSNIGEAFRGRPEAYSVAQQAVRAYYVGAAAKAGDVSGEINDSNLKRAVRAVLGEPVDFNGADVFPPWGMDEDDFNQAVEDRWPAVASQLPTGLSRDLDDYQLQPASGGRYYLVGAGGGFLADANGDPVQIDPRADLAQPAKPKAKGAASLPDPSWRR